MQKYMVKPEYTIMHKVYGNVKICDEARVYDNAKVFADTKVLSNAEVCGNAQIEFLGEICSSDDYLVVGPIGSRKDFTTFYLNKDRNIMAIAPHEYNICIENFKKKILEKYKHTKYTKQYLATIECAIAYFSKE